MPTRDITEALGTSAIEHPKRRLKPLVKAAVPALALLAGAGAGGARALSSASTVSRRQGARAVVVQTAALQNAAARAYENFQRTTFEDTLPSTEAKVGKTAAVRHFSAFRAHLALEGQQKPRNEIRESASEARQQIHADKSSSHSLAAYDENNVLQFLGDQGWLTPAKKREADTSGDVADTMGRRLFAVGISATPSGFVSCGPSSRFYWFSSGSSCSVYNSGNLSTVSRQNNLAACQNAYDQCVGTPSNAAPTIGGVTTPQTVTAQVQSSVLLSDVTLSDADGDRLTLTIVADSGTLYAPNGTGGGVVVGGDGSGSITLNGTTGQINTYLDAGNAIQFKSAGTADATLTLTPNDGTVDGTPATIILNMEVVATKLVFTTQPAGSVSGSALTAQPVVTAQDDFGNTDVNFTEAVTLTESSAGSLTGATVTASSGVATFTNLIYTATADQESFTLTANDQDGVGTNLPTVNANAVTADVVATKLVYDTQPAPLSVTAGEATPLTTVPVVSARDGNDVVDTGYSTGITLAEANGAGTATLSATGDTDGDAATVTITPSSGVATFASMQLTYAASGSSSENFNLKASSGGLTSVNSSQLTSLPPPPTITSATFDWANSVLVVTGTNFIGKTGTDNDVDISKLTITGEDGSSHTLAFPGDVEIDSATQFTVALSGSERLDIKGLLNKNGTSADGGTTYNLAAADDFIAAFTDGDTSDATGNGITVSNVSSPTVTSATYNATTGVLTVTGTNFAKYPGSDNDVDVSTLTLTGQGGGSLTLTTPDVELWIHDEFSITLNATDKASLASILNKDGTSSLGGTTYNLAAADNWMPAARSSIDIADVSGNGVTVSNVPAADTDGDLVASSNVSEPVALPTDIDSVGEALNLFDFTLSDGGSADGLSLDVSRIDIHVSGTSTDATRAKVTWRLDGTNASQVAGTYNAATDTLSFSGLSISVPDDQTQTYWVNAYYNDNTGLTDGDTFILSVDGDTDLTVSATGTQMGTTTAVTNGTGTTVDVAATALVFSTQPAGSVSGAALTTQPIVTAQDAFGNTDTDFTETITLSESSAGSLSGDVDVAAVAGVSTFTDVVYAASADQEAFTLTANDDDSVGSHIPTVNANAVTADVVATKLVFDIEPAPLSVRSGEAKTLTTVPVVSARDANGNLDTDYVTNIVLAEVGGAGSAEMTVTGDQDSVDATVTVTPTAGVATFTGMALTYTDSGAGAETFKLQASSGSLTSADSAQFSTQATDTDGGLVAATGVSEPVALPATADTAAEAVALFDFTLSDGGAADTLALEVSAITINVSGTADDTTRGNISWLLNGDDVSNALGTYSAAADTLTFSSLSISVADGASETYTLSAYFSDNTALTDGETLVLSVDGDTDLTVAGTGTQMGATSAVTNGIGSAITVPDGDGDGILDDDDPFPSAVTSLDASGISVDTIPQTPASTCSLDSASYQPRGVVAAPSSDVATSASSTGVSFRLTGCATGESFPVSIDLGTAPGAGFKAYKVSGADWTLIEGATITGSVISYTLTDNGPLDLDPANGVIEDPVAVAIPAAAPPPSAPPTPVPLWPLGMLLGALSGILTLVWRARAHHALGST